MGQKDVFKLNKNLCTEKAIGENDEKTSEKFLKQWSASISLNDEGSMFPC